MCLQGEAILGVQGVVTPGAILWEFYGVWFVFANIICINTEEMITQSNIRNFTINDLSLYIPFNLINLYFCNNYECKDRKY